MRKALAIALACLLPASAVGMADTRQVIELKTGAGAGLIGLGFETEMLEGGYGVWMAGGLGEQVGTFGIGLRWYFITFTPDGLPALRSRLFAGPLIGMSGRRERHILDQLYIGAAGGYEWRVTRNIRLTVEAGYGFVFTAPDPVPILGIAVGWRL